MCVVFVPTRFGLKCVTTDAVEGLAYVGNRTELLDFVRLTVHAGDMQVPCELRSDRQVAFIARIRGDLWMSNVETGSRPVVVRLVSHRGLWPY